MNIILAISAGLIVGFVAGYYTEHPDAVIEAPICPNGAIGQVIKSDGSVYCSYLFGKHRASFAWKEVK